MDYKQIGLFIAQERKAKNLTQSAFAEKLYVSAKTVSKWENGNGLPDTSLLLNICSILDISINELLCGRRLTPEMENKETKNNAIKSFITKRELETLSILTEILILAGIIITITLTSILATSVVQKIITLTLGSIVWGYGLFLRIKIRKALNKLKEIKQ